MSKDKDKSQAYLRGRADRAGGTYHDGSPGLFSEFVDPKCINDQRRASAQEYREGWNDKDREIKRR